MIQKGVSGELADSRGNDHTGIVGVERVGFVYRSVTFSMVRHLEGSRVSTGTLTHIQPATDPRGNTVVILVCEFPGTRRPLSDELRVKITEGRKRALTVLVNNARQSYWCNARHARDIARSMGGFSNSEAMYTPPASLPSSDEVKAANRHKGDANALVRDMQDGGQGKPMAPRFGKC